MSLIYININVPLATNNPHPLPQHAIIQPSNIQQPSQINQPNQFNNNNQPNQQPSNSTQVNYFKKKKIKNKNNQQTNN